MIFWSRKGQLGKIITSVPILISIIVILSIYLVFVVFAFETRGSHLPSSVKGVEFGDILFKEININGEKINFLDGIIKADLEAKKEESAGRKSNYMFLVKEAVRSKLETELNGIDEEYCLMLFQGGGNVIPENTKVGGNEKDIYYKFKNGKGEISYNVLEIGEYQRQGNLNQLIFNVKADNFEKKYELSYYYGRCLR